jgi:acyl dehydratase
VSLDLSIVGQALPATPVSWTTQDTLLYALSVGAGSIDPCTELELTTENSGGVDQVVLPSFGFVLAQRAGVTRHLTDVDPAVVLHAEQSLEYIRPLLAQGEAIVTPVVEAILDKGRSALVRFATTVTAQDGAPYLISRAGLFLRGLGGWGGERGSDSRPVGTIDRAPDAVLQVNVHPDQALHYRLCGDRNPLHSDPAAARAAGFERPILHGLCTLGMSLRMLLREFARRPDEVVGYNDLRSLNCRMSAPVMPGQKLTIHAWQTAPGAIRFETRAEDKIVIDRGQMTLSRSTS